MSALVAAIRSREADYAGSLDHLIEHVESDVDATGHAQQLREAVELVRCLRRLVPHCTVEQIHKAFGAPGDFGYETAIGDALARFYRGKP